MKLAKTHFSHQPTPEPERSHFISREGAWHGATLGALTIGDFKVRKDPFLPLIAQTSSRVSACSAYRGLRQGEDEEAYVRRLAQELDDEFQRIGPHKVCAFVAETVGGSVSSQDPGFFCLRVKTSSSLLMTFRSQAGVQCRPRDTFPP